MIINSDRNIFSRIKLTALWILLRGRYRFPQLGSTCQLLPRCNLMFLNISVFFFTTFLHFNRPLSLQHRNFRTPHTSFLILRRTALRILNDAVSSFKCLTWASAQFYYVSMDRDVYLIALSVKCFIQYVSMKGLVNKC